ncbi:unnamed protein product (macronuclear) [Paramecium tetraurelia]|uniref:Protein kinase domain-containing protein n=1 Tax=Paramecium tetraurelia TaxID=5888 RepID=A0BTK5_PARTE|nr:uncharacterized protein GSPATT00032104001 [Paramecium tetraurelia]CAK61872.1 unnamed protein product [Paramecium tetraurelia]|eukprot:XP_001429270.1 hypothetical protein (macronuclear) [Paramecium tetraurelia strain d4-2]
MGLCHTKKAEQRKNPAILNKSQPRAKIPQTTEQILEFAITEPFEDSSLIYISPQIKHKTQSSKQPSPTYSLNLSNYKYRFSSKYVHQEFKPNEKQLIIHRESGLPYYLEILESNSENRGLIRKLFNPTTPENQQDPSNLFDIVEICLQNRLILVVRQYKEAKSLESQLQILKSNVKTLSISVNKIIKIITTLHSLDIIHFNLSVKSFQYQQISGEIYLNNLSDLYNSEEVNFQYISPEQLNYIPYFTKECNIWALGMIICQLMDCPKLPIYNDNLSKFKRLVEKWQPISSLIHIKDQELQESLIKMLQKDPSQRAL